MRGDREGNLVMVADDNEFIRYIIKKWLGDATQLVEVGHGREVVDAYLEHKPDILFLDIHMPGKNGKEILKEIRDVDPSAFVIMVSGDSKKENVIYSVMKGAKAFMTKPFTRSTLERYYGMCPTITRKEGMMAEASSEWQAFESHNV